MKSITFLICILCFLTANNLFAQWGLVGTAGFSAGRSENTSIAIDGTGTPYVVYRDGGNSNKATVMKYNGSSWVTVGAAGFSAGAVAYTSIAIDGSNNPYVVYQDGAYSDKATVMKFNGTNWENVGTAGFSAGPAWSTSIAIDGTGTPYVVYRDNGNYGNATVMMFSGTSWVNVGAAGFSAGNVDYTSIAIDASGTPYVAYQDGGNSGKATVMKFDETSWVNVGTAGFSSSFANYTSIAIDGSGTPYVAYQDGGNSDKATVMKYNGTSWVSVGAAGFSAGVAAHISIAIDGSGKPYVAYQDWTNYTKATVMKYNGTNWIIVGSAGFTAGDVAYTSIKIHGRSAYVVFMDNANSTKATVMKYSTASVQANSITFSSVSPSAMTINWTNGDGSKRVVFVKESNTGTALPVNYSTYTANTAFRGGTQIDLTGWYCVYNGTGINVTITELRESTNYIVQVFEYDGSAGLEEYLTSTATDNPKVQQTSAVIAPTVQSHSIAFSGVAANQMTIGWTNGNGEKRAVFVKQASSGTASPTNNTTYTASTTFRDGTQMDLSGWYCVYNGTGTSVTLYGLNSATNYIVQVFEYNGSAGSEKYLTSTASDNPKVQRTITVFIPVGPVNLTAYNEIAEGTEYDFIITGSTATSGGFGGCGSELGLGGIYSTDSPCALMAVHDGKLSPGETKIVRFQMGGSPGGYIGCTKNGVTTGSYEWNWRCYSIVSSRALETPNNQSSNVTFSNITSGQMQINWTRGNGEYCVVFVKQGNTGTASPVNYTTYTANSSFGSGTQISESGWYCVYKGTGNVVTVSNLTELTSYAVHVMEYNYGATYEMYNTTTAADNPKVQQTSAVTAPAIQAHSIAFSGVAANQMTIGWTNGNGEKRTVFVKQASSGTTSPTNNTPYTASTAFGNGTQIGSSGWYCVYNGTGSSVIVAGLNPSTDYIAQVFEYNGTTGSEKYLTSSASDNPKTQTTPVYTNYALKFDGSDDYAGIPAMTIGVSNFTVECWFKSVNIGSQAYPVILGNKDWDGSGNQNGFLLVINYNGDRTHLIVNIADGSNRLDLNSATAIVDGKWHHIAAVFQRSSSLYLYVDGILEATGSISSIGSLNTRAIRLGCDGDGGQTYSACTLDEVRIWSVARDYLQIRTNMHRTLAGTETGLVGYWRLDEESGTTMNDGTVNGNNGMLNNFNFNPTSGWLLSSAPLGTGTSSIVSPFTSGVATLGEVTISTTGFGAAVDLVCTKISTEPNQLPSGFSSVVGNMYCILKTYPAITPGTFAANLTYTIGAGAIGARADANPGGIKLYRRDSNSDEAWEFVSSASSANSATGVVTFNNINQFTQFVLVEDASALPVELISFTAVQENNTVKLEWKTATEVNNYGFEVQRSEVGDQKSEEGVQESDWNNIGFVQGNGNSNSPKEYSFVDENPPTGNLQYRLKQIDTDGKYEYYSTIAEVNLNPTNVNENELPKEFALLQNYPNPFNPTTNFEYRIRDFGFVKLKVYDVLGNEVVTLVNEEKNPGKYEIQFDGSTLSSGIYIYQLRCKSFVDSKKFILMK